MEAPLAFTLTCLVSWIFGSAVHTVGEKSDNGFIEGLGAAMVGGGFLGTFVCLIWWIWS